MLQMAFYFKWATHFYFDEHQEEKKHLLIHLYSEYFVGSYGQRQQPFIDARYYCSRGPRNTTNWANINNEHNEIKHDEPWSRKCLNRRIDRKKSVSIFPSIIFHKNSKHMWDFVMFDSYFLFVHFSSVWR